MPSNAPVTAAVLKEALDPLNEAIAGVAALVGEHDKKLDAITGIAPQVAGMALRIDVIESGIGAILDHLTNGQASDS